MRCAFSASWAPDAPCDQCESFPAAPFLVAHGIGFLARVRSRARDESLAPLLIAFGSCLLMHPYHLMFRLRKGPENLQRPQTRQKPSTEIAFRLLSRHHSAPEETRQSRDCTQASDREARCLFRESGVAMAFLILSSDLCRWSCENAGAQ